MHNCSAIVLAAGKGTRMKSEKAKVVFQLAGKEMVRRVVDTSLDVGCDPVAVVVGYQKESVIESLPDDSRIGLVEQKEQQGTGHAIMVCAGFFKDYEGDILILCGDIPLLSKETLQELLSVHRKDGAACTVLTIKLADPASYGRIVRDEKGSIRKIVEFKDATAEERRLNEINTGIYCFEGRLLFEALNHIDNNNKQSEYYLTDTLEVLNSMGKKVIGLITDRPAEVTGINSQKELAWLEEEFYAKIRDKWLSNGVSIENPSTVIIGEDVEIEPDVEIAGGSIIKGKTKILRRAKIGPFCYLNNAVISKDVVLSGYNIVVDTEIPEAAQLAFQEKKTDE